MRRFPRLLWIALAILGGGLALLLFNHDAGTTLGLNNDDFGHLIYLGALITVLASSMVVSRRHFGAAIRNVAIWLAVFVVMMGGYVYRYELQDVASRMSAGIVPGSPLSVTDSEGRTTVQIERGPDGHFEVDTRADGESVRMVVDTGATVTVLTRNAAGAVGIDVDALAFNVPVSTANGTTMAARARLGSLEVGAIARENLPVLVAQDGSLGQSLLGMNFIGTLSGFDMRGDRLILRE